MAKEKRKAGPPHTPTIRKSHKLAAAFVERHRKQFEAGQDWALLDAVDFCARERMVPPEWAINAFCDRYLKWHLFQAKTLDEAFNVKRPKGIHIKKRARREWLKSRVVIEAMKLHANGAGIPFGEELFDRVGQKFGIKKSEANEIYYDKENHWREALKRAATKI